METTTLKRSSKAYKKMMERAQVLSLANGDRAKAVNRIYYNGKKAVLVELQTRQHDVYKLYADNHDCVADAISAADTLVIFED